MGVAVTVAVSGRPRSGAVPPPLGAVEAAGLGVPDVLTRLESGTQGLAEGEATRRLGIVGANAVRS